MSEAITDKSCECEGCGEFVDDVNQNNLCVDCSDESSNKSVCQLCSATTVTVEKREAIALEQGVYDTLCSTCFEEHK